MVNLVLHAGLTGWDRLGDFHRVVKVKRNSEKEDIGLRLLKLLLYRLYAMSYVIPLKWYEMLIAVVTGSLMGLGIGIVIGGYLKMVVR